MLLWIALLATALQAVAPQNPTIDTARRAFYDGSYESAATQALTLRTASPADLAAYELRTSALHFQIKRAMGDSVDKNKALQQCVPCTALLAAFADDTARGQVVARERLTKDPADEEALFLLGKIDLNHVWLHLGTLGRRTGWHEYWEARKSLDSMLKRNPSHVRARVARAWIDYIVDTKMTRGFRWILGGGNKKKALLVTREAAAAESDFFTKTEARFALWEMQIRERNFPEAIVTARTLARDFPENRDLAKFLAAHDRGF